MYKTASQNGIGLEFAHSMVFQTLFAGLAVCVGTASGFDELPDDFVEKTVAVVVRDREVHLEICVGANENTLRKLLTRALEPSSGTSVALESVALGTVNRESKSGLGDTRAVDRLNPNAINSQQLNDVLREFYFEKLLENLTVTINDQETELTKVSVEQSVRHHFAWVAKYSFEIPSRMRKLDLVIQDNTFLEYNGAARYALKATGNAMVLKSNVAPIIVRSQRHELRNLDAEARSVTCRIKASLGYSE